MQLTQSLVLAVEAASDSIKREGAELALTDDAKRDDSVGEILRNAVEEKLQTGDLLAGWVERARRELGMPPRNQ